MGKFTAYLFEKFKTWDRNTQMAFIIGVILLIPAMIVLLSGDKDLRTPATISVIGLIISLQAIVMWANRGMVTEHTRAQRHFMNGELEQARDILEAVKSSGKADYRDLTLLGNTYRQLGDLEASERVLSEALNINPMNYFPLYGFGRTLLVQGRYAQAQQALEAALKHGAPPATGFDLGEAHYYQGNTADAATELTAALPHLDNQRRMMAVYLLHQLGKSDPPEADLISAGYAYWQAQANLYQHTPYGDALKGAMTNVNYDES